MGLVVSEFFLGLPFWTEVSYAIREAEGVILSQAL